MSAADPLHQQFLDAGMDTRCAHDWDEGGYGLRCQACGERRTFADAVLEHGGPHYPLTPDTSVWDEECAAADRDADPDWKEMMLP